MREEEEEPHFRRFVASFSTTRTTTLKYQINVHIRKEKKIPRCRLVHLLTISTIFDDFSMEKSLELPISLRQLDLKFRDLPDLPVFQKNH